MLSCLLVTVGASFFSSAALQSTTTCRAPVCMQSHAEWVDKLIVELDDAADLAQRGGVITDVLRRAKAHARTGADAAGEAEREISARLQAAEARAAKALMERDSAIYRASTAEEALSHANRALKDTERQLAEAEDKLARYKEEASEAMSQLDDAYEHEQDRVASLKKELEHKKRALKEAQRESKLAAAREASARADTRASKQEKSEVELRLEEERQVLEGCLCDVRMERDALMLRCRLAEAKVASEWRAISHPPTPSLTFARCLSSSIHSLNRTKLPTGGPQAARHPELRVGVDLSHPQAPVSSSARSEATQ